MKRINTTTTIKGIVLPALLFLLNFNLHAQQFTVTGRLTTPLGAPEAGFAISVTGTENKIAYTDENGEYAFALQAGGSYIFTPVDCIVQPLNGVSTYDAVLFKQHRDGTQFLSSPYQVIAGDLNGSNSLDIEDDSLIRKLILSIIDEFPAGNYAFVPQDYVFPDPIDPFTPPYPRSKSIANLQADIEHMDFFAIKLGDANNTSIATDGCNSINFPARLTGRVFHDLNLNCLADTNEIGLAGWLVIATNSTNSFFSTTTNDGYFEISAPTGTYDVSVSPPNNLWDLCADTIQSVSIDPANFGNVNFGAQAQSDCPFMQVELSTWGLRRCFTNKYTVNYCNLGTSTASSAHVEVDLDPFFEFSSSTIPATHLSGNTYSFEVGDVPAGYCGQFEISFLLSCDAMLGQTHCSEARIYPDTICSIPEALWTGPDLHVEGICDGEEVKFTITNHGGDMIQPAHYIVVEDIVVMTPPIQNPFTLSADQSIVITIPANGTTVRLEVNQATGHPWTQKASAVVEGCGTNTSGGFSTGMVNQFPQNDESPLVDVDCRANTGSYDPNDKQGFPTGVLNEHYIPLKQPLEYLIRFQNTGTDTAFTVIIRDTLDPAFDLCTLRPAGSSHPCDFNISGPGVAQFVFTNIQLPDSTTNEPASHGFVKFTVKPKDSAGEGTVIRNQAAIFFDFNNPVFTNETWHTLGSQYLKASEVVFDPAIGLDIFPNPATDHLQFLLKSPSVLKGNLFVYEMTGRLVSTRPFNQNNFDLNTKDLQPGNYFYKIISEGQVVAAGKFCKITN